MAMPGSRTIVDPVIPGIVTKISRDFGNVTKKSKDK